MELRELLKFIDLEDRRIIERFGKESTNKQERILARTVKLTEELGELCNEVLASSGDQRGVKLKNYTEENLLNEFADVIITTLLLAKSMNVNIEDALAKKIEKIHERYK